MALGRSIAEVEEFSSREVMEWMAYSSIEPFGEERADLRMAILARTVANRHRNPKNEPKPYTILDFMPDFDRKVAEPLSPDALTDMAKQMFGHPGTKAKKKGKKG